MITTSGSGRALSGTEGNQVGRAYIKPEVVHEHAGVPDLETCTLPVFGLRLGWCRFFLYFGLLCFSLISGFVDWL